MLRPRLFFGFRQEIHGNLLLENGIAHIFLVLRNTSDGVWLLSLAPSRGENTVGHKDSANISAAFPCQSKQINEPNHTGPSFLNLDLAILAALISQQQSREMIDALGIPVADGLGDVLGDGSAFFLGERTHQGNEKLAGAVHGVDILLLKVDCYPGGFQAADGSEGIHSVSGKPGQGLGENQVNFSI